MLLKWLLLWPGDKQLLFCNVSSQRNAGASISDLVVLWYFFAHIKMRHSGETTAIYLIAYGIIRYIIEWFRGDLVRGVFGRWSTSQAFSAVAVIGGISILFYLRKRKGKITHGFSEEIP